MRPTRRHTLAVLSLALAVLLPGCGARAGSASGSPSGPPAATPSSAAHATGDGTVVTDHEETTADGGRRVTLGLPDPYTPHAPSGGTDDYHCQLLDPHLTADTFLTGFTFRAGNPTVVHHAIFFRVPPDAVAAVRSKDAETPDPGWTCFGDSGIPQSSTKRVDALDRAGWLGAWAPGGKPAAFPAGTGVELAAGTQIVVQLHYNLLAGGGTDSSGITLNLTKPGTALRPLHTMLLPAPVDLPCAASQSGPLCDRTAALGNLGERFGPAAAARVGGLDLLCGVDPAHPRIGPTQTCTRPVRRPITVVAVAGHMHLLGRTIRVERITGAGRASTLLDIPVWNFDDQGARRLPTPVALRVGDQLRVTCTHDAALRDQLPELAALPDRHVLWGEGTSDEMCLGIVTYLDA